MSLSRVRPCCLGQVSNLITQFNKSVGYRYYSSQSVHDSSSTDNNHNLNDNKNNNDQAITYTSNNNNNNNNNSSSSRDASSESRSSEWDYLFDSNQEYGLDYMSQAELQSQPRRRNSRLDRRNDVASQRWMEDYKALYASIGMDKLEEEMSDTRRKSRSKRLSMTPLNNTIVSLGDRQDWSDYPRGIRQRNNRRFGHGNDDDRDEVLTWIDNSLNRKQVTESRAQQSFRASLMENSDQELKTIETEKERERRRILEKHLGRLQDCSTDRELFDYMEKTVFMPFSDKTSKSVTSATYNQVYPLIVKEAMKMLVSDFNNPNGAISIFDRTKAVSAQSYVLGCNTDLYNEALRIKWDNFMDLFGLKQILEEMIMNGVEFNDETEAIMRQVKRKAKESEFLSNKWLLKMIIHDSERESRVWEEGFA
ncbi:hypothetical protein V1514DRAFT_328998 [Lipomyces japonicus]|uniref:uncharacterized protein n=1 Tax=Lipomyces japonicus TaxID=56871 RepID=UPI0034CEF93A